MVQYSGQNLTSVYTMECINKAHEMGLEQPIQITFKYGTVPLDSLLSQSLQPTHCQTHHPHHYHLSLLFIFKDLSSNPFYYS